MIKCNRDQIRRMRKALKREKDAIVCRRIGMVFLREDRKTGSQLVRHDFHRTRSTVTASSYQVFGGDFIWRC
jgi:hypothetical protein